MDDTGTHQPGRVAADPARRDLSAAALEVRAELVQVTQELFASGLLTATGGNVSARIPGADEAWITPSQLHKGSLAPETMVRITLDGDALDPGAAAPSRERLLHGAVYRARPDVAAVVHAHATYATVIGLTGLPFTPITAEAAFFGEIPRVPFIMPGSAELATAIRDALGDGSAVLLQNHGLVVAGSGLRPAANAADIIEHVAHLLWSCRVAGLPAQQLPAEALATLRAMGRMLA